MRINTRFISHGALLKTKQLFPYTTQLMVSVFPVKERSSFWESLTYILRKPFFWEAEAEAILREFEHQHVHLQAV